MIFEILYYIYKSWKNRANSQKLRRVSHHLNSETLKTDTNESQISQNSRKLKKQKGKNRRIIDFTNFDSVKDFSESKLKLSQNTQKQLPSTTSTTNLEKYPENPQKKIEKPTESSAISSIRKQRKKLAHSKSVIQSSDSIKNLNTSNSSQKQQKNQFNFSEYNNNNNNNSDNNKNYSFSDFNQSSNLDGSPTKKSMFENQKQDDSLIDCIDTEGIDNPGGSLSSIPVKQQDQIVGLQYQDKLKDSFNNTENTDINQSENDEVKSIQLIEDDQQSLFELNQDIKSPFDDQSRLQLDTLFHENENQEKEPHQQQKKFKRKLKRNQSLMLSNKYIQNTQSHQNSHSQTNLDLNRQKEHIYSQSVQVSPLKRSQFSKNKSNLDDSIIENNTNNKSQFSKLKEESRGKRDTDSYLRVSFSEDVQVNKYSYKNDKANSSFIKETK